MQKPSNIGKEKRHARIKNRVKYQNVTKVNKTIKYSKIVRQ